MLLAMALNAVAATVTTQAGKLAQVVTNHNIGTLVVEGSLDARDFKFIVEELEHLTLLDLSGVTIKQYTSSNEDQLIGDTGNFEANVLPSCALAGHPSLQTIILPSSLTAIGYGALAGCTSLNDITFPASLQSIGDEAFNSCHSLQSVIIGGSISHLGRGAFAHCSNLESATIKPNVAITVGDNAFMECGKLSNLELGAQVTAIGDNAFGSCRSLNEINIEAGSALTSIGNQAFYRSALKRFDFAGTPLLRHLGAWSMAKTLLKSVDLPAHVKQLDEGVFFYNRNLSSLQLPKSLNYLSDYMLAGCTQLNGTTFMTQSMGNVGDFALYNQSQHSSINVPFQVYYIGTRAMAGMTGLKSISSEAIEVPELGDEVWAGLNQSNIPLNVSKQSVALYRSAPQWMNFFVNEASPRGDVNGDGYVTTSDVTGERGYVLNNISDGIVITNTDVNGDGEVDVADIISIFNIINGTQPALTPQRIAGNDWIMGEGKLVNSRKTQLDIRLHNNINYTAFQLTINAPSHLTITKATATHRCLGHELHLSKQGNNSYKIMGYSPANDDIESNDGIIITLEIESTKNLSDDDSIDLPSIIFADSHENAYILDPEHLNLIGVSSIDNINVDESSGPVNVYNIQGQLLRSNVERDQATQGLPAGIYIVGGKKVVVR